MHVHVVRQSNQHLALWLQELARCKTQVGAQQQQLTDKELELHNTKAKVRCCEEGYIPGGSDCYILEQRVSVWDAAPCLKLSSNDDSLMTFFSPFNVITALPQDGAEFRFIIA